MLALALIPVIGSAGNGYFDTMTPARWRDDVRHLARDVARRHRNAFHFTSREQFDEAVTRLEADLPHLPNHQVPVRMLELTAMIGDAHTYVQLPPFPLRFPLQVDWVEGELRVVRAAPGAEEALGGRVLAIEGTPVQDVHRGAAAGDVPGRERGLRTQHIALDDPAA